MTELLIKESENNDLKLGKALFILLNDQKSSNTSNKQYAIKEATVDADMNDSTSTLKLAFNAIDMSLKVNSIDSMSTILECLSSKFIEIVSAHKHLTYEFINRLLLSHSDTTESQRIPIPQHHFKCYRLFRYLLQNHFDCLFECLQSIFTNINIESTKQLKSQLLDILIIFSNYICIFTINSDVKNSTTLLNYKTILASANKLYSIISIFTTTTKTPQQQQYKLPTRLSTQSSDTYINLMVYILIHLKNDLPTLVNNNQIHEILSSIVNSIKEFINELNHWNKPTQTMLIFSFGLVTKTFDSIALRLHKFNETDFENIISLMIQILPLLYYNYSLSTKNQLLSKYTKQLLCCCVNNNNQFQIYQLCYSIFIILGNLSEKNLNNFIKERFDDISEISVNLMQYTDENIQIFNSKFIEFIFNIKILDTTWSSFDTILSIIDNSQTIPLPLVELIGSSICKYPQILLNRVISRLKESDTFINQQDRDSTVDHRIENSLLILSKVFEINPNFTMDNYQLNNDIMNHLLPFLKESIHYRTAAAKLLKYLDIPIVIYHLLPMIFSANDKESQGSIRAFLSLFEITSKQYVTFELYLETLLSNISVFNDIIINNSNNNNNNNITPNDIFDIDDTSSTNNEMVKSPLNNMVGNSKNLDKLMDLLAKIVDTINEYNGNWSELLQLLLIKLYSNSKDTRLFKMLPVILPRINQKSVLYNYLVPSILSKLESQESILEGTQKDDNASDEEYIFKLLTPMLILNATLKESWSQLKVSQVEDRLFHQLKLRLFHSTLMLQIRKLSSDCISYLPLEYSAGELLERLHQLVTGTNINEMILDIKLIIFIYCNIYLNNLQKISMGFSSRVLAELELLLKVSIKDTNEQMKLNNALSDLLAFIIRSVITKTTPPISITSQQVQNSPVSITKVTEKLSDLLPTVFRILQMKTSLYTQDIDMVLVNSLTIVSRLLGDLELHIYSKLTFPMLIKTYFNVDSNMTKALIIQTLYSVIYKLVDYQLEEYSLDLFDLCESSLKSSDNTLKLSGLKLVASLMKSSPATLFQSTDNIQAIYQLLLKSSTNLENPDIRKLSGDLINLFK
ncbi:U3 snoRNP protein [Tieghemostelium lacteum]|uniref:U3 snoRNP protein n=1 Tax=Tieghemostelium lacteum TaxID=361077 RepID=A0A152A0R0_TIELA|nr:U3 snoRNP protein [Tieghemostelium lacteum]|eukprot:KYQ99799.1 U3 snoRNP protein [Tieghemostelium lacteum]